MLYENEVNVCMHCLIRFRNDNYTYCPYCGKMLMIKDENEIEIIEEE